MRLSRWNAFALGVALALAAAPLAAGFNELVQVVCDVDSALAGSCDATADGLRFVNTVAVSADDKHVYFCSSLEDEDPPLRDETLSAFSRGGDGSLTLVDQESEGVGGVGTLESCRGVAVSPDGKHVYTAALTDSAVTWFSRDAGSGALTFTAGDAVIGVGPGSSLGGATALVVSPDDKHVYVASRSAGAVAAFSRNTTSGDLTSIGDYFDGGGIDGLAGAEEIAISPDGKHVYVAGQNDDAVAVFSRDTGAASPTFGELTFVEAQKDGVGGVDGLDGASSVALDAAGANVYATSQRGGTAGDWLAVFSRSAATGELTFLESFQSTALNVSINCSGVGPSDASVAVSPDGLFVAASEPFRGAIATFSRATDGTLDLVASICDDIFVLDDGIGAVVDLAISPDGENLYAAGGAVETLSTVDYECDSVNVDLVLSNDDVIVGTSEDACRSVAMGPDYNVLTAGTLTVTAPLIRAGDDVSFAGDVELLNAVP